MTSTGRPPQPHVVVVGDGFAGISAAHALAHSGADVTLLDRHNYHTFQPLLYQVSTGYLPPEEVGAAFRSVFRRQANLTVRVAVAVSADWTGRRLRLQDGSGLDFDYLILAAGAETNFFGIPGMAEHSWPLYTLADAVALRTHLLGTLEEVAATQPSAGAKITTVVVGGGPTGVETAAALASMAREVIGPVATLRVILVEAGPRLLAAFSAHSSQRALHDLRRHGVDVRLGQNVEAADPGGVTLGGGERIPAGTVIWAAGVQANRLGHTLGLPLSRGRVAVDQHLQVAGYPNVFVAGDLAAVAAAQPGALLPMLAPAAIQAGRHAGEQVARLIASKPLARFRYHDKGMMAVLGRGEAVAELPLLPGAGRSGRYRLRFAGLPAWLLWGGVHIAYLICFSNRIKVLVDWGWSYRTSRGAGAILVRLPGEQVLARAPERAGTRRDPDRPSNRADDPGHREHAEVGAIVATTSAGPAATEQPAPAEGSLADRRVVVVIATPLEAELVALIEAVDDRLDVRYEPDLLPASRFPCDHRGIDGFRRTEKQESRWRAMMTQAEVLFGLPGDSAEGLAEAVRASSGLRWVQATAGGAGEQVRAAGLTEADLARVTITSASGVHAGPLAEFAMFGLLAFARGLPRLLAGAQARRWEHYPVAELAGRTLLVVGLGSVGREVVRLAAAFGMHVIAINRTGRAEVAGVDEVRPSRFLADLLPVAHAVVVTLPLTEQTRDLIDAAAISRMRTGAVLVNVGRGGVVDEQALIQALQDGRLAGAALDVFATEPLPAGSPLWRLPNVLISPHTAALSVHENERITALFTENLRRYLRGDQLLSRVHPALLY